jgi:hypothetical protein
LTAHQENKLYYEQDEYGIELLIPWVKEKLKACAGRIFILHEFDFITFF